MKESIPSLWRDYHHLIVCLLLKLSGGDTIYTAIQVYKSVQKYFPPYLQGIFKYSKGLTGCVVAMSIVFLFPECWTTMEREVFIVEGLFYGTIYNLL